MAIFSLEGTERKPDRLEAFSAAVFAIAITLPVVDLHASKPEHGDLAAAEIGALSQKTAKLMVFTLVRTASKKWRKYNGTNQLPRVIEGVRFADGVIADDANESRAA